MKKIICVLLSTVMLLSVLPLTSFAASSANEATVTFMTKYASGDLNGDGRVSSAEARTILRVAAGLDKASEGINYDADADGLVSSADALKALRVSLGLEARVSTEEILTYFVSELNSVKTTRPGFSAVYTGKCTSMKVTSSGWPLLFSSFNATNMEFKEYIKKFKSLVDKEDYEKMVADAEAAYDPQVEEKTVTKGASQHITYFPVKGVPWSCNLTPEDIKSIAVAVAGNEITMTLTMGTFTYVPDEYDTSNKYDPYPTGSGSTAAIRKLPYGKVFNLPNFNSTSQYDLRKLVLKNGKVVVKVDATDGSVISADYSYSYSVECNMNMAEAAGDSDYLKDVVMYTTQVADYTENYVINPPVAE